MTPIKLAAALLTAATITAVPNAHAAAPPVLFIGGTGQSATEPAAQSDLDHFVDPLIDGPFTASQLLYNAQLWDDPGAAAPALNHAIVASDGTMTVIGLSKGAQVVHAVLIAYSTDPNAPSPDKVRFIALGDPNNPQGLLTHFAPAEPQDIKYNLEYVHAQYDIFADSPDNLNPVAWINSLAGFVVHSFYGQGGPLDPLTHLDEAQVTVVENTTNGVPNGTYTTTRLIPTNYLPMTLPIRLFAPQVADVLDGFFRPIVDLGYNRGPVTPTAPVTEQQSSSPADVPDVSARLVSVPEKVKAPEPVKPEPKNEPKPEKKDVTTDGNKFSPGDTVAEKESEKTSDAPESSPVTADEPVKEEIKADPAPKADSDAAGDPAGDSGVSDPT